MWHLIRRYAPMISTSWFVFNCNELDDGMSQLMPVCLRMCVIVCVRVDV
jgi:hypothetical protein